MLMLALGLHPVFLIQLSCPKFQASKKPWGGILAKAVSSKPGGTDYRTSA